MRAWLDFTCSVHIIQDDSKKSCMSCFFFLYRAPTIRCTFLQPVLVLPSTADSTQDPQIHQQPPSHLYLCANCNRLFAVHVTSLRCHCTGSAERGQRVISFLAVCQTWVGFIRSKGKKKEANRKNTWKVLLPLKKQNKKNHLNMNILIVT